MSSRSRYDGLRVLTMTEAIDEHRETLEAIANSDLNSAWIAEALLEAESGD